MKKKKPFFWASSSIFSIIIDFEKLWFLALYSQLFSVARPWFSVMISHYSLFYGDNIISVVCLTIAQWNILCSLFELLLRTLRLQPFYKEFFGPHKQPFFLEKKSNFLFVFGAQKYESCHDFHSRHRQNKITNKTLSKKGAKLNFWLSHFLFFKNWAPFLCFKTPHSGLFLLIFVSWNYQKSPELVLNWS